MNKIEFYSTYGKYGCFSSFYTGASYHRNGYLYKTREHDFQFQKRVGTKYESQTRNANGPMEAKKIGNDRSIPIRKDWDSISFDVMIQTIIAQCQEHSDLRQKLLDTRDAVIIEHTINDAIWGDGGNGKGKNLLGKAWMKAREFFKGELNNG